MAVSRGISPGWISSVSILISAPEPTRRRSFLREKIRIDPLQRGGRFGDPKLRCRSNNSALPFVFSPG
jgi:hypothetical protein